MICLKPTINYYLPDDIPSFVYEFTLSYTITESVNAKLLIGGFALFGDDSTKLPEEYSSVGGHILHVYHLANQKFSLQIFSSDGTGSICIENLSLSVIPQLSMVTNNDLDVAFDGRSPIYVSDKITQYSLSNFKNGDNVTPFVGIAHITMFDGETTYKSNWFNIQRKHDCSLLLSWTNSEPAFNFDYTEGFYFNLRVNGKLRNPNYRKDRKDVFVDAIGRRAILFSRTEKVEKLQISDQPEWVHDALSIAIEHDKFEIDNVEYICEATEYDPIWRKLTQLAQVEIDVIKNYQNLVNSIC